MISNETKENLYKKEIIIEPSSQYENSSKITKNLNLPKKDYTNLTNIKSYFQNTSDIYKEKVLNIEAKQNIKEKKNASLSPCISKITGESIILKIDKMKEKLIYNSFIDLKPIK